MERKNGRKHGEVFTQKNVVKYILDEVKYSSSSNLERIKILEPASGQGAFAIEIIKRLFESSKKFNFDFIKSVNENVRFIEIDNSSYKKLKTIIFNTVNSYGFNENQVEDSVFLKKDFLINNFEIEFDCIVGNPPYIRHELIESSLKEQYKKIFSTFKYRADLYVLFYEKSLQLLNSKGVLSFICSNRWLFNQYGQPLRKLIANNYHISKIINIEKANVFDEDVIAYPCVTTVHKTNGEYTEYFESQDKEIDMNKLTFTKMESPKNESWQNLFLDYNINHNSLIGIREQGFEIGIGVATGADKVYIKKESELNGIEKNRLIPIIKSRSLKGENIDWDNSYVINPFEQGQLCDLSKYPHLKSYLESKKEDLLKRHIAKKSPDSWYKTIDKIKPDLQSKFKLLLPDLSGCKFLFIDEGNFYPHHNIYYITHHDLNKLKILASILMSDFIKDQLSQIGIRMNGGLPRFQSQTLKKLRIPNLNELTKFETDELIKSYNNRNLKNINKIVNKYCTQHCIKVMAESVEKPKHLDKSEVLA
ncbi:Eco57I restriction-modification methylase domain-containing protein [Flagellimonas sp. HMM57]|uniref:Eco57I restriction-modification methylase domain-containing protein n=1 Tax=unclassified Flagellimonas TaxID=2644544 RepID=UPI0013D233AE|nr:MULTISPECIES: Eco57I restriction-modification methylase domain-containing protein [unclassified Flagellimonas]UII77831.1 Eco57I restriction-modification methylase domain-containing protein [Flagellimonas sp. HMM57]